MMEFVCVCVCVCVAGKEIGAEGAKALGQGLEVNSSLQTLNLTSKWVGTARGGG